MSRVVILSGAGISAESGISTFRDSDGLWENYDIKVVCNYDSMYNNEAITQEFYDARRNDIKDKKPNRAHLLLSELKHTYPKEVAIITQNVDDLFEKAGLREDEVIHLHGFLPEIRCQSCQTIKNIGYESIYSSNNAICSCGGKMRPNIVFFGEQAPMYERLNYEFQDCEIFVVIGTSGYVIGVNSMANFIDYSILNNLEPSDAIEDGLFDKVIYDKASIAIDEIIDIIEEKLKN